MLRTAWLGGALAFALLISSQPLLADCSAPSAAVPIRGALPVRAEASDREKAAFALPYAHMIGMALFRDQSPPGYFRGPGPLELLVPGDGLLLAAFTAMPAALFIACATNTLVIAFDGVGGFDPRQYLAVVLRRADGGYAEPALDYVEAVLRTFPDRFVSVIGHSEGGSMASYAAGALGLPSITFNAARTVAATTENDGQRQLNIVVRGDPIADPASGPGLAGTYLYLNVVADNLHGIETVRAGLFARAQ